MNSSRTNGRLYDPVVGGAPTARPPGVETSARTQASHDQPQACQRIRTGGAAQAIAASSNDSDSRFVLAWISCVETSQSRTTAVTASFMACTRRIRSVSTWRNARIVNGNRFHCRRDDSATLGLNLHAKSDTNPPNFQKRAAKTRARDSTVRGIRKEWAALDNDVGTVGHDNEICVLPVCTINFVSRFRFRTRTPDPMEESLSL